MQTTTRVIQRNNDRGEYNLSSSCAKYLNGVNSLDGNVASDPVQRGKEVVQSKGT